MRIAPWITADGAGTLGIEIAADLAGQDRIRRLAQAVGQRLQQGVAFFQQGQRRALSESLANDPEARAKIESDAESLEE